MAPKFGVIGLALAYTIDNILNFILLWIWLAAKVGSLDIKRILVTVFKFTISALAAGIAAQITKVLIWPLVDMAKFSGVFLQLAAAGLAGILIYAFFCYLFNSEELFGFLSVLSNRWPFKKVDIDDSGEARGV